MVTVNQFLLSTRPAIAFFTQMLYQCIARIQPVIPWFLQSFWLTIHTHAAVWLPKSCNQCAQLGAVGGRHGSRERKSTAPQQLDCVARISVVNWYPEIRISNFGYPDLYRIFKRDIRILAKFDINIPRMHNACAPMRSLPERKNIICVWCVW